MRSLFVTNLYEAELGEAALHGELAHSIRTLARDDEAGRRWSREHRYAGYTSYASLNDLPQRDPAFAELAKLLARHAVIFAEECAFELSRKPRLDSLWVNLLKSGGHHSGHIHPHSIISGTLYVEVPTGSGAIRFEDPRLPLMMAAPPRRAGVSLRHRPAAPRPAADVGKLAAPRSAPRHRPRRAVEHFVQLRVKGTANPSCELAHPGGGSPVATLLAMTAIGEIMGFRCGIVGLPNVGKSTLFNALTETAAAQAANYPFCTIEPNVGRVAVPDARLDKIARDRQIGAGDRDPDRVRRHRRAGPRRVARAKGLGNQFLANIREVDAIVHVLRCFEGGDVTHVEGRVDPIADAETVETELMLADLDSLERRVPNLVKKAQQGDKEAKIEA